MRKLHVTGQPLGVGGPPRGIPMRASQRRGPFLRGGAAPGQLGALAAPFARTSLLPGAVDFKCLPRRLSLRGGEK